MQKQTLILIFHPNFDISKRNRLILDKLKTLKNTTIRSWKEISKNLQRIPPEKYIEEQRLLLRHDRIIFQYPVYWFNVPAIGKQYMDEILTLNFAFKRGEETAYKLKNKEFKIITTTGDDKAKYEDESVLCNYMKQCSDTMGMIWQKPFILYNDDDVLKIDQLIRDLEEQ